MRLFISYARVDKPYCRQIIELLDMHEVWYDQRLHIGQKWWDQIIWRLNWCEGYLYLLSPDSVTSEYCRRELDLAISLGKHIFPVLIQTKTEVPESLKSIQYADLSNGLDVAAAKTLLTAIFLADRPYKPSSSDSSPISQSNPTQPTLPTQVTSPILSGTPATQADSVPVTTGTATAAANGNGNGTTPPPVSTTTIPITPITQTTPPAPNIPEVPKVDGAALIDEAADAFCKGDFDKATRALKAVMQSNYTSRFIDVPSMLRQAEEALKRQAYEREAQREYTPIANMMRNEATRAIGCNAFKAFQATFPDYDPDNLKVIYEKTILTQPPFDLAKAMPLLEWCRIPAGKTTPPRSRIKKAVELGEFFMSKYPITNAQFQAFIDASDGYNNPAWWQSSLEVRRWHADHPTPIQVAPGKELHPRTYVCWYEAAAFCQWLSYKTGWTVKLPTEQQWQRAAQGDTGWRFPWGGKFDPALCNTKETEAKGTTAVNQYPKSASPYGVWDMLGNVWEWCSNGQASGEITDVTVDILRIVRGGSFMSPRSRTSINFHYVLNPLYRYQSIGFRIICETGGEFLGV